MNEIKLHWNWNLCKTCRPPEVFAATRRGTTYQN